MAASQITEKNGGKITTHRKTDESSKKDGVSTKNSGASTRRFQETAKQIIYTSPQRWSSTGTRTNVRTTPTSIARPTRSAGSSHPHHLVSDALVHVDASPRGSHHTASRSVEHLSSDMLKHGPARPMSTTVLNPASSLNIVPSQLDDDTNSGYAKPNSRSRPQARDSGPKPITNASSETSESIAPNPRIPETSSKPRNSSLQSKGSDRPYGLCNDCKAYTMESVCFISNDGRISAVHTGAAFNVHHFHRCAAPRCAANPKYHPSSSASMSKKVLLSKRQYAPPRQSRLQSSAYSGPTDHQSVCSSATSSIQGDHQGIHVDGQELRQNHDTRASNCSEGEETQLANIDMHPHCGDEDGYARSGFPPLKDRPLPVFTQDQWSNGVTNDTELGSGCNTPTYMSCISSSVHDDTKIHIHRDEVEELNDFKSFFYHGDNEYSCSDDGTDITTTPKSSTKGKLDDMLKAEFDQSMCDEAVHPKRSMMARMRQKYLESLREQEAETVRLRKQEIMARKQAGEWMLDGHMEEVLQRLAPNGEARVKVLVEAFETIIHLSDSEGSQTHHQDHNLMND